MARGVDVGGRRDAALGAPVERLREVDLGAGEDREIGEGLDRAPRVVGVAGRILHADDDAGKRFEQARDQRDATSRPPPSAGCDRA